MPFAIVIVHANKRKLVRVEGIVESEQEAEAHVRVFEALDRARAEGQGVAALEISDGDDVRDIAAYVSAFVFGEDRKPERRDDAA
jgi:hypothetical protein